MPNNISNEKILSLKGTSAGTCNEFKCIVKIQDFSSVKIQIFNEFDLMRKTLLLSVLYLYVKTPGLMKYFTYIIAICVFSKFCTNLYSQTSKPIYDTSYIKSYRDYLIVTFVSVINSNTVEIEDNNAHDISFSTNLPLYLGFAIDYKWLTFEYTNNINTSPNNNKGQTQSKSYGFGITGQKFWFRSFWKDYQGYYLENPGYDNPDFNEEVDPYPLRPDLRTKVFFTNLNYGFNYRKYSNTASLWQIEKQKKSAGSFTVGLSAGYTESMADSSVVLARWEPNFGQDALIQNYHLFFMGINGGYLHTFSLFRKKNFFFSLAIIPGLSYQYGKAFLENNPVQVQKNMIGSQIESRVVFGYNHDKWYSSVSVNAYSITNAFSQDNSIIQNYVSIRMVYGRKIKLRETKSDFLRKIGL
jgi:hypothetical protein